MKNNPNKNEPVREVVFKQTKLASAISYVTTVGALVLLIIMFLQLKAIRHEQAVSLRPYIHPEIEDWPGATQVYEFRNVGKENEIWELAYWVKNVGSYPARKVYCQVQHTTSSDFTTGGGYDTTKKIMVNPNMTVFTMTKSIPRSEVIDMQKSGDRLYRHFYVRYEDDKGTKYSTRTIWVLLDYEPGKPITWQLVKMQGD